MLYDSHSMRFDRHSTVVQLWLNVKCQSNSNRTHTALVQPGQWCIYTANYPMLLMDQYKEKLNKNYFSTAFFGLLSQTDLYNSNIVRMRSWRDKDDQGLESDLQNWQCKIYTRVQPLQSWANKAMVTKLHKHQKKHHVSSFYHTGKKHLFFFKRRYPHIVVRRNGIYLPSATTSYNYIELNLYHYYKLWSVMTLWHSIALISIVSQAAR